MSVSYAARAHGPHVRLARRIFHGVERPEYDDLATLSPCEARALADELRGAADDAEASAEQTRVKALADARKKAEAIQIEIARLEAGAPT